MGLSESLPLYLSMKWAGYALSNLREECTKSSSRWMCSGEPIPTTRVNGLIWLGHLSDLTRARFVSGKDKNVKIQINTGPSFFAINRKKGAIVASVNQNMKKRETIMLFKLSSEEQIGMDEVKKAKKLRCLNVIFNNSERRIPRRGSWCSELCALSSANSTWNLHSPIVYST